MGFWKTKSGIVFDAYGGTTPVGGLSYNPTTNRLQFNDGYSSYPVLLADGYGPANAYFSPTQIILNSKLTADGYEAGGMILKRGVSFGNDPIFGQSLFEGKANAVVVWKDTT